MRRGAVDGRTDDDNRSTDVATGVRVVFKVRRSLDETPHGVAKEIHVRDKGVHAPDRILYSLFKGRRFRESVHHLVLPFPQLV